MPSFAPIAGLDGITLSRSRTQLVHTHGASSGCSHRPVLLMLVCAGHMLRAAGKFYSGTPDVGHVHRVWPDQLLAQVACAAAHPPYRVDILPALSYANTSTACALSTLALGKLRTL